MTTDFEINFTKPYRSLKDRIVAGSNIEDYILANYTTNKIELARVYEECLKLASRYLQGVEREEPVDLFSLLEEASFNDSFLKYTTMLEYYIIYTVGVDFKVVKVIEVKRDNENILLKVRRYD